jgi:hydroxycarboxylate dehydrogenase B
MDTNAPVLISAETLENLVRDIFVANGCDAAEAWRVSHHLLGANLAGHDSHGVARVPRYVDWQQAGYVQAGQQVDTVMDGGAFALLDGKWGFGQTVAEQATAFGIGRAKQHGVAVVALKNAGHIGRTGAYAEQALAEGLISIHFVNVAGSVLVAPFGGTERRFSTAPIAIGVPTNPPAVLDFATSLVAEGKVLVASNGGKPLPPDALIEPDGRFSGDPHTLYGEYERVGPRSTEKGAGAIRAFGEHKGSGLALMCELLAGAFTGGGTSGPVEKRGRIANGMLSIYISPSHFGTQAEFIKAAEGYVAWVKSCRPAEAGGEVLAPGEPEARRRADRLANGVPLQPDTWDSIVATARKLGVKVPN